MKTHLSECLALLQYQIGNSDEVAEIESTARDVAGRWVRPLSGGKEETNGLIYGLVQSGKTGVLAATAALGADEGYRTIIVLTSDIDPLYDQTLSRAKEAFPGLNIIGKGDLKDQESFLQKVRTSSCAIVLTKNASVLRTVIENFKKGNVKGLTALIIDDEADQASLNTKESKPDGTLSTINELLVKLRAFFDKNTYLQVTATPQALFLRDANHGFRPKFTVLSHPGANYVGGEDFFGDGSKLCTEFSINDIASMTPGAQPAASHAPPASLVSALDVFMVGATFKRSSDPTQNCAFLCHVSSGKSDHKYIEGLLHDYKTQLSKKLTAGDKTIRERLEKAYDALCATHEPMRGVTFDALVDDIKFYAPGIAVKIVNSESEDDIAVRSPYNLFVGGNKLGRGVTIRNLLVSYYGRNPRSPQADTVLQHARMYGYRRGDKGLLRLYLPAELHRVFRSISKMEDSLRELIARAPTEEFRGVYVEGRLKPTRKNVIAPGSIGAYAGGNTYNPANVLRTGPGAANTARIDSLLASIANKTFAELPLSTIRSLVELTMPDPDSAEGTWDSLAIAESIEQLGTIRKQVGGMVYVDRDRELEASRRETAGIISGGEGAGMPTDHIGIFMLRQKPKGARHAVWWPQVRFPSGQYAFAFAI